MNIKIRRLERDDTSVFVEHRELLDDPHAIFLVAFDGDEEVGFVLAHDLPRRHGNVRQLFVYEVDVAESHRRRGIGRALLGHLAELGIHEAFVLTEPATGGATNPPPGRRPRPSPSPSGRARATRRARRFGRPREGVPYPVRS